MKTTPIQAMERHTDLQPLEDRREEKVFIHSEKILRLQDHPLHDVIKKPTKNRIKRQSFNHLSRTIHRHNQNLLPDVPEHREMLHTFEEPEDHLGKVTIITSVPGIEKNDKENPHVMKSFALDMIDSKYPPKEWTHVFTDGSADGAVKNGGAGIFIRHTSGTLTPKAFPTGKTSSNFRAETSALLAAVKIFSNHASPPPRVVFFTDCKSVLDSLQNQKTDNQKLSLKTSLQRLSERSEVVLQWIPSHCGINGNEKADKLSKVGSKMEQFDHQVSYKEAKTIIKNKYRAEWKRKWGDENTTEAFDQLSRHHQTIIFRLRTGHCRLLSHMYKLGLSHTPECPCGTELQNPEHVL